MESWEGLNYYTENNSKWAQLMNLSAAELNLGWLPSNLVAIPGPLNSSWHFPPDTLVIENASVDDIGDTEISPIVFGIASGIAILWAVIWICYNLWKETLWKPRSEVYDVLPTTNSGGGSLNTSGTLNASGSLLNNSETADNGFYTLEMFQKQMEIFYPRFATEIELRENQPGVDEITGEDVEKVTEELRKMYDLTFYVWSLQNASGMTEGAKEELEKKSDAILSSVRDTVNSWNAVDWNQRELAQMTGIWEVVNNRMPVRRYDAAQRAPL